MSSFIRFRNRILAISAGLLTLAEIFCLLGGYYPIALGAALGGGWSLVKLILHAYHLQKFAGYSDTGAKVRYTLAGNLSRYIVTGAVLAVGFAAPFINEWAVIGGVFLTNAVMIAYSLLEGRSPFTARWIGEK
ncbi:MAG: hypothetical protein DRP79_02870 [Planctomycetota bacterium]|nr:MAG: hypothetical protein DRP79_02870 [Planctomycetota bacterium]